MNAHDFDRVRHHGVGIPEDAYDEVGLRRVLEALVACQRVRWLTPSNQAEIERLRGTPAEPVPISEIITFDGVRFADDFRGDRSDMVLHRQQGRQAGQIVIDRTRTSSDPSNVVDIIIGMTVTDQAPTKMYTVKNREREQLDALLTYQGSDFVYDEQADNARHARTGD